MLRILQLNLWNDDDTLDERLERAADLITRVGADVVTIQEVAACADGTPAEERLAHMTGMHAVIGTRSPGWSVRFRQGLLTRLPVHDTHEMVLPGHSWTYPGCSTLLVCAHVISPSGRTWHVGSTHLAWGGPAEPARCKQVQAIERHFEECARPGEVAVLGGDLNCEPESDTVRFLTGRHPVEGAGAYWLDSWDVAGDGGPGATSGPGNENALATAAGYMADPTMLPSRRIDYVLVRGWAWGNPGMPLHARVIEGAQDSAGHACPPPSDHFAVVADLWDPPLT